MARGNITWDGLNEFKNLIKNMDDQLEKDILYQYGRFGVEVEGHAKKLAPEDERDLMRDISSSNAERTRGTIEVAVGTNMDYAVAQHERPEGPGGKRTQAKPSHHGYRPGRKYLANAVLISESNFIKMNSSIIQRVVRGKKGFR